MDDKVTVVATVRYGVYIRHGQKWACPWTYATYAEAQTHAKQLRDGAFYDAVKVKKVHGHQIA